MRRGDLPMSRVMLLPLLLLCVACLAFRAARRWRQAARRRFAVYGTADGRLYDEATTIEEARAVVVALRRADEDSGWQTWGQGYRIVQPPQDRAA
jgi:hypothetical protein